MLKLLDLYCGAGGATFGYQQAGFHVTGVDINEQPHYRGNAFHRDDAVEFLLKNYKDFDCIHASPPCQHYSNSAIQFRKMGKVYPNLIKKTREALISTKKPYIIENVPHSPLINPITLCGAMFGLRTYRHRLFESNINLVAPDHPVHQNPNAPMGRKPKDWEYIQYVGHFSGVPIVKEMTGLTWLNQNELAQSIPPQYTLYLGIQLKLFIEYSI
jgi:DNA (cytosine-5)-methyltransferase 1